MTATPMIRSASLLSLTVPGAAGKTIAAGGNGFAMLFADVAVSGPIAVAAVPNAAAPVKGDLAGTAASGALAADDNGDVAATPMTADDAATASFATTADSPDGALQVTAKQPNGGRLQQDNRPVRAANGKSLPAPGPSGEAPIVDVAAYSAGPVPPSVDIQPGATISRSPVPIDPDGDIPGASTTPMPVKPPMIRAKLLASATMPSCPVTLAAVRTPDNAAGRADRSGPDSPSSDREPPSAALAPIADPSAATVAPLAIMATPAFAPPVERAAAKADHYPSSSRALPMPADGPSNGAALPDAITPVTAAPIEPAGVDTDDKQSSSSDALTPSADLSSPPAPTAQAIVAPGVAIPAPLATDAAADTAMATKPGTVAKGGKNASAMPAIAIPIAPAPATVVDRDPLSRVAASLGELLSAPIQPVSPESPPTISLPMAPSGATPAAGQPTPPVSTAIGPHPTATMATPASSPDPATFAIPAASSALRTTAPVRIVGGAALQALSSPVASAAPPLAMPAIDAPAPTPFPTSTATTPVLPALSPALLPSGDAMPPRPMATDVLAARPSGTIPPSAPPVALAAAPAPAAPTAVGTTALAAQAFAAAIEAADRQDRLAASRGATDSAVAATAATSTAPIAATADANADQPSLDMRQQSWPATMIDHIEKLRDDADATSTRIRVVPDALGSIDVSVRRHDDGAVQVSLVADRPQTQAMIAEARPELTRLADERGTRIDVNVGGGSAGATSFGGNADSRQPATQPQVAQRRAPAPVQPDDTTDPADGRVA